MRKKVLILIYAITFISCNQYNNRIIISNESNYNIDSIIISTNMNCKSMNFIKVKANSKIDTILNPCVDKQAGDGCFHVSLFTKKQVVNKSFGYYTNGSPMFKQMKINYQNNNKLNVIFE